MKGDGRKLDRSTQAHVRRQVVLAVRKGMTQVEAAKVFGMSLRFVQKTCARARDGGLRSLKADERGRPAGAGLLDGTQQARIYRMIIGKMPDQLRLPFYLWTRQAVVALVKREYGDRAVADHGGTLSEVLGHERAKARAPSLRAQRRGHRAVVQQDLPGAGAPGQARGRADLLGRRDGECSDHQVGTSYRRRGQTPTIPGTGKRFGCNMISAITNRGQLLFMVFKQRFTTPVFLTFLRRLVRQVGRKAFLIVDGHPVHRAAAVKHWVAEHADRLRLFYLPGYSPKLNPDELLNQDVKSNALGKSRPTNKAELLSTVRAHLHRRQKQPQVVRNLFREQHVRYAA